MKGEAVSKDEERAEHKCARKCMGTKVGNAAGREREKKRKTIYLHSGSVLTET